MSFTATIPTMLEQEPDGPTEWQVGNWQSTVCVNLDRLGHAARTNKI